MSDDGCQDIRRFQLHLHYYRSHWQQYLANAQILLQRSGCAIFQILVSHPWINCYFILIMNNFCSICHFSRVQILYCGEGKLSSLLTLGVIPMHRQDNYFRGSCELYYWENFLYRLTFEKIAKTHFGRVWWDFATMQCCANADENASFELVRTSTRIK